MPRRGLCFVIAAPSGAGKSTIIRSVLERERALFLSVSVTTRAPRAGEIEGVHYYYRSREAFDRMAAAGDLLEHATVFGRSYGTPRAPVEAALRESRDILFVIDWQGYRQLRAALPEDVVGVFIKPPNLETLAARLTKRGDSPEEITRRMAHAEAEMTHAAEFDYQVENADFDTALADLRAILRASRLATARKS